MLAPSVIYFAFITIKFYPEHSVPTYFYQQFNSNLSLTIHTHYDFNSISMTLTSEILLIMTVTVRTYVSNLATVVLKLVLTTTS